MLLEGWSGSGPCIGGQALGVASGAGPGQGRGGARAETPPAGSSQRVRPQKVEKLLVPGARVKAARTGTTQQGSGLTFGEPAGPAQFSWRVDSGSGEAAGRRPEPGCRMPLQTQGPRSCAGAPQDRGKEAPEASVSRIWNLLRKPRGR